MTISAIAQAARATDKPLKTKEVHSDKVPGLLLKIQPSGSRTFYVLLYKGAGGRIRIGAVPEITLEMAEQAALDITNGKKPKIADNAALRAEIVKLRDDFARFREYMEQHCMTSSRARKETL